MATTSVSHRINTTNFGVVPNAGNEVIYVQEQNSNYEEVQNTKRLVAGFPNGHLKSDYEDGLKMVSSNGNGGYMMMSLGELCAKPVSKLKQEMVNSNRCNDVIVTANEGETDVTLEYMDLDEFLQENGLTSAYRITDGQIERAYPINLEQRLSPLGDSSSNPSSTSEPSTVQNNNTNLPPIPIIPPRSSTDQRLPPLSSLSDSGIDSPKLQIGNNDEGKPDFILPDGTKSHRLSSSSSSSIVPQMEYLDQVALPPPSSINGENSRPSSSAASTPPNVPSSSGRGRRRSSTKSMDSGRSGSPLLDDLHSPKTPVKRSKKEMVPDNDKDDKYWNRRAKNNAAAKRSRDSRREREAQISMRTKFLETENLTLKEKLDQLHIQNEELKRRLSKYEQLEM